MSPALPLIAALVQVATLHTELGLRTEGRGTALEAQDLHTTRRTQAFVAPLATFGGDLDGVLFTGSYAPRFWSSDLKEQSSFLVSHSGDLRLDYRNTDRNYQLWIAGAGVRSQTDPLADPWQAAAPAAGTQVATARSLGYEDYRGTLGAQVSLTARTIAEGGLQYYQSQVLNASDRALLPPQKTVTAELALRHLVTDRDTLRVSSRSVEALTTIEETFTTTGGAAAPQVRRYTTTSQLSSTTATWLRRLGPTCNGWIGGGATLARTTGGPEPEPLSVQPAAEAGILDASDGQPLDYSVVARLWTFLDRFEGGLRPMSSGTATLGWRPTPRFSLRASATGGARLDGKTRLASGDLRATRVIVAGLSIELGAGGSLQKDVRPTLPTYVEATAFSGLSYRPRQRLLFELGAVGRRHVEHGVAPSFSEGAVFLGVSYGTGGMFLVGNAPAAMPGLPGEPPPAPASEGESGAPAPERG